MNIKLRTAVFLRLSVFPYCSLLRHAIFRYKIKKIKIPLLRTQARRSGIFSYYIPVISNQYFSMDSSHTEGVSTPRS